MPMNPWGEVAGRPPVEEDGARRFEAILARGRDAYRGDRFGEARVLLGEALVAGEQVWGGGAIELVPVLKLLALAIAEGTFGDHNLAAQLALHQRVVHISEDAYGLDDRRTGSAVYAVGLDLWGLGRRDEALDCFLRALTIARRAYDDEHFVVREVRGALGNVLSELGRAEEAIALLRREAEIADAHAHNGNRMVAHWYLGQALLRARRWEESARSLEQALALADARPRGGGAQAQQLRAWLNEARSGMHQTAP